jgi:feruloyl esterase
MGFEAFYRMIRRSFAAIGAFGLVAGGAASADAQVACEAMTDFSAPDVRITAAAPVATPVALCKVDGVIGKEIHFSLWLPTTWNGKFVMGGQGGYAGRVDSQALGLGALEKGYAVAGTDTGHVGPGGSTDGSWALGNMERVVNYGHAAIHRVTATAKAVVQARYGRAADKSYFAGCSNGGRQALMSAQRYPDDFDAIVAGAPVYNMVHLNVSQTALQVHMLKNPERIVSPNKVTLIANAATAACDANDGVKDNIINDPRACKFDPGVLACKAGDAADCLTAGEIESARQLYAPVKAKSGQVVYPGRSPGVESGWAARIPVAGKPVSPLWGDMPRFVGHRDANWDAMSFDLDKDLALTLKNASFIEASDPNLSKFKARGGKLLLWHGWADPGPAPENTINYYSQAAKASGSSQDEWMRLFLLPGVAHCGGGVGPDQADFLGAMERWREQGTAPAQITASRNAGRSGLTPMARPLCPFPQIAKYKGAGSTDDAANFVCAAP